MKKQKFCYSRFLSIILSLALLCSALVFPISVNAATDNEAKAAAATALKTAWQKLENEHKGTESMYPNQALSYNSDTSPWIQSKDNKALSDQFLQTSSGSDADVFGTKYTTLDTADSRVKPSAADGKISLFFGANKLGEYKDVFINKTVANGGCSNATGFYIYVRVTNLQNPITVNFARQWMKTTGKEIPYTIRQDGLYRLTDDVLYNGGIEELFTEIPTGGSTNWMILQFSGNFGAKIEVGALHWTDSNSNLPDDIENISALNLITKASLVENSNKYISQNWADFQTALTNAKAAYAAEFTASDLKAAFKDMLPDGKSTGYTDARIDAMENDELLVAATSLHTNYGVYDGAKLTAFNNALEAFKAANYTPEAAARITLKAAYKVLQTDVAQYGAYAWYNVPDGVTKVTTSDDTDKKYLGTQYVNISESATYGQYGTIPIQTGDNNKPALNTFEGFYFYIKVTAPLTQDFRFGVNAIWNNDSKNYENICVLPKGTEPGYYLFTDKDFYSQGYSGEKGTHKENVIRVVLQSPYSGGNICVGSGFGYKYVKDVPTGSENWSLEKFANYTVNYIDNNNYIISDTFRKLFADAQKLGAGVYNGDFANGADGFKLKESTPEYNKDNTIRGHYQSYFDDDKNKIVVENLGWKTGGMLSNKVVVKPNTDYVLTYRFKASAKTNDIRSGINLVGNNKSLDSSKISITVSLNAVLDDGGWAPTNWIRGIRHTDTEKLVNVAVRFNSGDNDYLNMSMAFQGDCNYTYDYFKLTEVGKIKSGNVNGDAEVDILDLVVLKKFLNDGDTEITFEAAKVNTTGTTVNNDDFNALRSKLLDPTFQ